MPLRSSVNGPRPAVDSTTDFVDIHYRRLPGREDVYRQRILARSDDCIVTFSEHTPIARPLHIDGRPVLEPGAPAIWFTFPGAWHDIGRFHLGDGTFTGTYANAITPVRFLGDGAWQTTDLFLDLWLDTTGRTLLLDEAELEGALEAGVIDAERAARARAEMKAIDSAARQGTWPPPVVRAWSLERARAVGG